MHAETVRIHPVVDGNGRSTRRFAGLVFAAAQDPAGWQYDWDVAKRSYIELLRAFDGHRNANDLVRFADILSIDS